MNRFVPIIILHGALTAFAAAQAGNVRTIEVTVAAVSGRSVFIDKGRAAGVAAGQRVTFQPVGLARIEGVVAAAATDSARVELPAGTTPPLPGSTGLVEVPEPVTTKEESREAPGGRSPDHPPWERKDAQRSPDMPLLAPAFGTPPWERDTRLDGRLFAQLQFTQDQGDGRNDSYVVSRVGTWMQLTNPFGAGGRIEFAGELDLRNADVSFDSDTELQPILDVLSYTVGDEFYSPYMLQLGRFYPSNLPEIGVIDGAAGAVQLDNGVRAGGGFGVFPRPFPDRDWGEDLSLYAFADYHSEEPGLVSAILAYQHTWHDGDSDRDLILGRVSARPLPQLSCYCAWWLDIYTSDDVLKGPGVDLTQFWAQARYTPLTTTSVALSFSHSTWAETKRRMYQDIPPDLIADGQVNRLDLTARHDLLPELRLSGALGYWGDQNGNGLDGSLALDWDDATGRWPSLHGEIFFAQGSFNDGRGLRIQARQSFGDVRAFLGYELFAYSATSFGGQSEFLRHIVQMGLDWTVGPMTYSLNGDVYFGDGQGAYSIGLFAEYRF